jgi:hypothetical protein
VSHLAQLRRIYFCLQVPGCVPHRRCTQHPHPTHCSYLPYWHPPNATCWPHFVRPASNTTFTVIDHSGLCKVPLGASASFQDALELLCSQHDLQEDANGSHYTYAMLSKESGKWYVGVRRCPQGVSSPEDDVKYQSSSSVKAFRLEPKIRTILTRHTSRDAAIKGVNLLHILFDVVRRPGFVNMACQTLNGFDRTGSTHSMEAKAKISKARQGKTHTTETKLRIRRRAKAIHILWKPRTGSARPTRGGFSAWRQSTR